jgi:arylformamidase
MPDIIDLSHNIHSGMQVYPGTEPPSIREICSIKNDGFKESLFTFYSHIGTHLDVPAHIFPNGKSVEMYNCNKFFGKALVINCNSEFSIDLLKVKSTYLESDKPDFILFQTGWSEFWGDARYFNDFPVLTNEAARYLCTLPIKGIGMDTISFDKTGDHNLNNHNILLEKEIILVENLCCLKELPKDNFYFSCLPLKIDGADGAPTRAFAIIS